ncbi:MAG: ferrochelatase [Rhodospirillales bacterium]|nr:ferrochelatase [Rhodospirillales bacterium]
MKRPAVNRLSVNRLAVVLFNLGGPDGPDAVQPFLFNLFNDAAIIGAPGPLRWLLAKWISARRAPVAQKIYAEIGGKSPILELTINQAHALDTALAKVFPETEVRSFVCMRYWHPMSDQVVREVKAFAPDQVVLLPLYPQFSTTTTQSSFDDWARAAAEAGLNAPTKRVCCFPTEPGFIAAQAHLLRDGLEKAKAQAQAGGAPLRVLFSAHGLPKKIVEGKGDPYPEQVQMGAAAIAQVLQASGDMPQDWLVSYQSRVGPLEWIQPSTDTEIERAGRDGCALVVVPIAFVSEHSETLVELDIEYKHLAERAGVKAYVRVPTVGTQVDFIDGLAHVVAAALQNDCDPCPQGGGVGGVGGGGRVCTAFAHACPARMIG